MVSAGYGFEELSFAGGAGSGDSDSLTSLHPRRWQAQPGLSAPVTVVASV